MIIVWKQCLCIINKVLCIFFFSFSDISALETMISCNAVSCAVAFMDEMVNFFVFGLLPVLVNMHKHERWIPVWHTHIHIHTHFEPQRWNEKKNWFGNNVICAFNNAKAFPGCLSSD